MLVCTLPASIYTARCTTFLLNVRFNCWIIFCLHEAEKKAILFVSVCVCVVDFWVYFSTSSFFVVVRFYALATIRSIPSWIALCFLFPHTFMCSCIPFYLVAQPKRTHRIESIFNLCIAKHLIVCRQTAAILIALLFTHIFTYTHGACTAMYLCSLYVSLW